MTGIQGVLNSHRDRLFEDLKQLLLDLRDKRELFRSEKTFTDDCLKRSKDISARVKALPSDDIIWLEDQYKEWYNKEIKPIADKLDYPLNV